MFLKDNREANQRVICQMKKLSPFGTSFKRFLRGLVIDCMTSCSKLVFKGKYNSSICVFKSLPFRQTIFDDLLLIFVFYYSSFYLFYLIFFCRLSFDVCHLMFIILLMNGKNCSYKNMNNLIFSSGVMSAR